MEALQLENEHLNGLISALMLKVKKTEDLEKELASLRQALHSNEKARDQLRDTIAAQAKTLNDHKVKNEKFQTLIIEENRNLKNIILEKD